MENLSNSKLNINSTIIHSGGSLLLSESSLISNLESFGENEFKFIYDKIDLIFEEEIKGLRINFSFDKYENL